MSQPILEFKNVKKAYQGNAILKGISFSVAAGEIHGLIGENGAGKSTLMNILFGMPVIHQTGGFSGDVIFAGKPASFKSPRDAMNEGIGMVHQEFMLIPGMTVFENIRLNNEPVRHGFFNRVLPKKLHTIDIQKMRSDTKTALNKIGLSLDENVVVSGLPVGYKQFIEIAREICNPNVKLLVFDEPTAVLTESEAQNLLQSMRHLAKDLGIAILFISHRLDEIEQICDTVTILRDGELVGQYPKTQINREKMAELMVGHKVGLEFNKHPDRKIQSNNIILDIKKFSVEMPGENVCNLDLQIRRGEILGLGGLAGQGKIGIANGLAGLYPATGDVTLDGKTMPLQNPLASLNLGLGFLSEDRRNVGLLLDDSIENNIAFTALHIQNKFLHKLPLGFTFANTKAINDHANNMIKTLDIRCRSASQETRRLSGGNQQKVCLARIITLNPKILLVSEPTRGVDIGAKRLILEKLIELNQKYGMTIIVTSSELTELKAISDRIAIISRGQVSRILLPGDPDRDFGLAMAA